jgi:hypothetical protein
VQGKRSSERREVEGRSREQGQKGWRIDLSSREKEDRNVRRKRNSKEKGRRGREETTRTSSGHAVTRPFVVSRPSPPVLPTLPIINTRTSISPLLLNPQRHPSRT